MFRFHSALSSLTKKYLKESNPESRAIEGAHWSGVTCEQVHYCVAVPEFCLFMPQAFYLTFLKQLRPPYKTLYCLIMWRKIMMNNDIPVQKEINIIFTFKGVCHIFFGYSHIVYGSDNPLHRPIATLEKFPFIQKYYSSRCFIVQLGGKKNPQKQRKPSSSLYVRTFILACFFF